MPKTKSTDSASPSVSEIKEMYERTQKNYDTAMKSIKQFRNANQTDVRNISQYDRERIRGYLQKPGSNEVNLRNAARYLYYRSSIFARIINWYASMWDLRCRKVIPRYDMVKANNNPDEMIKNYQETLDMLDIYSLHGNIYEMLVKCYLEDVAYALFFRDEDGSFFYILDPDECKIDGRYMTGDFSFAINMTKWSSPKRQALIEWLGSPLKEMYAEYMRDQQNNKWVHVPDEYAACFKFRSPDWEVVIPPFSGLLQELAGLNDLGDIQAVANQQSIYKLLVMPIETLSGAKTSDDFVISPDLAMQYFDKLVDEALPPYISAAPIPGNKGLIPVDFKDSAADKDIDRLGTTQDQILATAGGGAVLNANYITSTAAFNAWLKAETEFALSSLMPQIENFTNRMLQYDLGNPCKVEYFEVSVYTKDDYRKNILESAQYGYNNKIFLNTFLGISEKTTLAMAYFEEDVLSLHEIMQYPLQSSYTTSNTGEVGQGRDALPDEEIAPSTERSRNKD